MRRLAPAAVILTLASGMGAATNAAPAGEKRAMPSDPLAFAQAACGGCHAVEAPDLSPNPMSPPFAAIANRPGLTEDTLRYWLSDAHNYPEEMDFDLDPPQIDLLVRHILSLKDANYRPPPS